MLVVDDDAGDRTTTFADASLADYEGGYADVKVISRSFVDDVAARGSEPARWAFEGAFVVWSNDDGLAPALKAAAAYPDHERDAKLRDFVSHAAIAAWYLDEAARHDDPYLRAYATSRLALYAGRAVLAFNRLLYPFHKWFLHELERASQKPPGFLDDLRALLDAPESERAWRLAGAVQELTGHRPTIGESAASFIERTEWSWRTGGAPLEES